MRAMQNERGTPDSLIIGTIIADYLRPPRRFHGYFSAHGS